jgi:hypothetical protein
MALFVNGYSIELEQSIGYATKYDKVDSWFVAALLVMLFLTSETWAMIGDQPNSCCGVACKRFSSAVICSGVPTFS